MSNPDSFLDEVAEAVRQDRFYHFARRYGWILVLLIVLVVGGVGYWDWQRERTASAAEAFGDALMAASASQDAGVRALQLSELAATGDQAAVRDLLAAGDLVQTDSQKAADLLRALIDTEAASAIYRDIARLKLVQMADNRLTTDQRLEILAPLTPAGQPFRLTALELRAMVYIEQRETGKAMDDLRVLFNDAESSAGQKQRARQMIIALGGDPEAV